MILSRFPSSILHVGLMLWLRYNLSSSVQLGLMFRWMFSFFLGWFSLCSFKWSLCLFLLFLSFLIRTLAMSERECRRWMVVWKIFLKDFSNIFNDSDFMCLQTVKVSELGILIWFCLITCAIEFFPTSLELSGFTWIWFLKANTRGHPSLF